MATQDYFLAKMLAKNGRTDEALEFLQRAKDAGFRDFWRVESDPEFKAVVKDPRYNALVHPR
jgi:pentatricopeptide repeat protein